MADILLDSINTQQAAKFAPPVETPVVETPVVETPVTTPVVEQPKVETPVFDQTTFLKETFGTENLDEVKTSWSGLAQLKEQNALLTKENTDFKPIVEAYNKSGDVGKLFVDSIAKGIAPEVLAGIYKLKPEDLTPEQAWKINEQLNKPFLTQEQIDAKFYTRFNVDESELDDNVRHSKAAELAEEAQAARSGIKDYIGKTLNPIQSDPAVEQAKAKALTEQLQQSWTPILPTLANGLKEVSKQIPIQTFGAKAGETVNVDFKYNVPADVQKAIMEEAYAAAVQNGVKPDENGLKSVAAYADKLLWSTHGPQIAKAFADDAVTHMTAQFEKIMNNPELAKSIHTNAGDSGLNAHEQSVLNGMKKRG